MKKYNGHKNYNFWNVSLWIGNDYGLYCRAKECIKRSRNKMEAAIEMLEELHDIGIFKTPDGVKYSKSSIYAALVGL